MTYRLLPYGNRGLLVEFPTGAEVVAHWAGFAGPPPAGVTDVVPAARTVFVGFDPALVSPDRIADWVRGRMASATPVTPQSAAPPIGPAARVELRVHYDGPDLAEVAERTGCSVDEVIARHTGPEYTVQFCGFAPGFGYLAGLDPRLRLPRLASPRPAVPAGSVAVADEYSGVYPRASPGGWLLLGRTDAVLFDPARTPPALLVPGTRVRFRAT